jgi:hypothetical protein
MAMRMDAKAEQLDAGPKHADAAGKVEILEHTIGATRTAHEYGDVDSCTCPLRRFCRAAPVLAGSKSRTPADT